MALDGHVIVVGFGRVGQSVVRGIREYGAACLVIDRDAAKEALARAAGAVALVGDATSEEDLAEAGISRASGLVAAAESDEVNLVVVLTARALNPGLRIVSRVNDASWARRIANAGADVVQSPYPSYGSSLAAAAMTPSVVDLHVLPLLGIGTEEIRVADRSALVGRTLESIAGSHPGAFIVGLRREERLRSWDQVSGPLLGGDVLVALGRPVPLRALAQEAVGREPPSAKGEGDHLARVGRPVDGVGQDVSP